MVPTQMPSRLRKKKIEIVDVSDMEVDNRYMENIEKE
jgi:hypothetical protein|tara:strand:+ start:76 stop:186 length:111 start_codon:yes stop_codon:yes gene_type:complete